jgi:hypothetical protein
MAKKQSAMKKALNAVSTAVDECIIKPAAKGLKAMKARRKKRKARLTERRLDRAILVGAKPRRKR